MNKLLSYLIERNLVPELQKGSLGIPRSDMPQISSAHMKEFLDYARGEGVKVYHITLPASKLKPTQAEINSDKVDTFVVGNKPLMISSDNYVLDGHHQWAKIILTDENRRVDCVRVDMPIRGLLDLANNFSHTTHKSYTGEGTMKKLNKLLQEKTLHEDRESELITRELKAAMSPVLRKWGEEKLRALDDKSFEAIVSDITEMLYKGYR